MKKDQCFFIVIDDDALDIRIIEKSLSSNDFNRDQIRTFKNGKEALLFLQQRPVNDAEKLIILCDTSMPVMDGFEFATALGEIEKLRGKYTFTLMTSSPGFWNEEKVADYPTISQLVSKPIVKSMIPSIVRPKFAEA